jgi:hypothetical protein
VLRYGELQALKFAANPGADLFSTQQMADVGWLRRGLHPKVPVIFRSSGLQYGSVNGTKNTDFQAILPHSPPFAIVEHLRSGSGHPDHVRRPDHLMADGIEADQQRAVSLRRDPGVAAMIVAMTRVTEPKQDIGAFIRASLPELGMIDARPAIERVGADTFRSLPREGMTTFAAGGRQFSEIPGPADRFGATGREIATGAREAHDRYYRNRGHDGQEDRDEKDVSEGPVKSINSWEHD